MKSMVEEKITYLCGNCGHKETIRLPNRPAANQIASPDPAATPGCELCGQQMFPEHTFGRANSTSGTYYAGSDRQGFVHSLAVASFLFGGWCLFFSLFGFWYPVLNLPVAFVGTFSGLFAWSMARKDLAGADPEEVARARGASKPRNKLRFLWFRRLLHRLSDTILVAKMGTVLSAAGSAYWLVQIVWKLKEANLI